MVSTLLSSTCACVEEMIARDADMLKRRGKDVTIEEERQNPAVEYENLSMNRFKVNAQQRTGNSDTVQTTATLESEPIIIRKVQNVWIRTTAAATAATAAAAGVHGIRIRVRGTQWIRGDDWVRFDGARNFGVRWIRWLGLVCAHRDFRDVCFWATGNFCFSCDFAWRGWIQSSHVCHQQPGNGAASVHEHHGEGSSYGSVVSDLSLYFHDACLQELVI